MKQAIRLFLFLIVILVLWFVFNNANFWKSLQTSMISAYGYTATAEPIATIPETAIFAKNFTITPTIVPETIPEPTLAIVIVKTDIENGNLNLRVGPSTSSTIITTLQEGESLRLISCEKDWVEVEYKKLIGYVYGKYLDNNPCIK